MLQAGVLIEELEALVATERGEEVTELVAPTEDAVELVIAEADEAIVRDGTAVEDLVYIGPHAGAQAHVAGLACGVDGAAGQVVSAQMLACLTDGSHLTMAGGIVVAQHAVVTTSHDLTILDNDGAKGTSMAVVYALAGLGDGELHVFHFARCCVEGGVEFSVFHGR